MASTLSVSKIQGLASAASPTTVEVSSGHTLDVTLVKGEGTATTNLKQGLIKHWCHFKMNTAAVNDSFNNSSITDQATGQFTMNLTNAMASAGDDLQLVSGVVAVGTYGRDGSVRTDTRLTSSTYDLMASLNGGSFYDVVRFSGGRVGDLA